MKRTPRQAREQQATPRCVAASLTNPELEPIVVIGATEAPDSPYTVAAKGVPHVEAKFEGGRRAAVRPDAGTGFFVFVDPTARVKGFARPDRRGAVGGLPLSLGFDGGPVPSCGVALDGHRR